MAQLEHIFTAVKTRLQQKFEDTEKWLINENPDFPDENVAHKLLQSLSTELSTLQTQLLMETSCGKKFTDSLTEATDLIWNTKELLLQLEEHLELPQPPPLVMSTSALNTYVPPLPKLELKTFDGDISLFDEFWESFAFAVDTHPLLPSHKKF